MTEEQKKVFLGMKEFFSLGSSGDSLRFAQALEACWADRERAVKELAEIWYEAYGGLESRTERCLEEMGESPTRLLGRPPT